MPTVREGKTAQRQRLNEPSHLFGGDVVPLIADVRLHLPHFQLKGGFIDQRVEGANCHDPRQVKTAQLDTDLHLEKKEVCIYCTSIYTHSYMYTTKCKFLPGSPCFYPGNGHSRNFPPYPERSHRTRSWWTRRAVARKPMMEGKRL